jgi:sulfur carrier protein ThiS
MTKLTVEFLGLTTLSKAIGKSIVIELPEGSTVSDIFPWLNSRFGKRAASALLDTSGQVDDTIQVIVNDEGFLKRELWAERLVRDGDTIKLMLLVGGG